MTQALPQDLELQWLGTAGFALTYQDYCLAIDPHLSRYNLRSVLTNEVLKPQTELLDLYVPNADAILVGHTHFDHALDVPELARRRDCQVYGSTSLRTLMGLRGQANQVVTVEPGKVYSLGPFDVTFIRSLHSKLNFGLKVNGEGKITCDHFDQMHQRSSQPPSVAFPVYDSRPRAQVTSNLLPDSVSARTVQSC